MSDQKLKIGQKGGAKEVAKKLSEIRKKPISKAILDIVSEIDQRKKENPKKKIAKSENAEI